MYYRYNTNYYISMMVRSQLHIINYYTNNGLIYAMDCRKDYIVFGK